MVYVGSDDRNVYAFNASTGPKLWSYTTGDIGVDSSPAVVNGVVYVESNLNLYAFGLPGGQAASARPSRSSPHPHYSLPEQR